jgi:hypothetical protein
VSEDYWDMQIHSGSRRSRTSIYCSFVTLSSSFVTFSRSSVTFSCSFVTFSETLLKVFETVCSLSASRRIL